MLTYSIHTEKDPGVDNFCASELAFWVRAFYHCSKGRKDCWLNRLKQIWSLLAEEASAKLIDGTLSFYMFPAFWTKRNLCCVLVPSLPFLSQVISSLCVVEAFKTYKYLKRYLLSHKISFLTFFLTLQLLIAQLGNILYFRLNFLWNCEFLRKYILKAQGREEIQEWMVSV